jgi:CelD/BcsL family acetyltransferase involved in cellulose biosynthesis
VTPSSSALDAPASALPKDAAVVELQLSDLRWRTFVASHPDALVFHRPAWAEMIVDCYGYRPFVLASLDADGTIAGGLPVIEVRSLRRQPRWVALPFSDLCPPLLSPQLSADTLTRALDDARRAAGVPALEVRAALAERANAHLHRDAVIHTTTLERDPDALFARCHHSQVQRNVRRAEQEHKISIRRADSARDLTRCFYSLHVQTRRRQGMPVQPRRFFEALWTHLLQPGDGYLLLAHADSEPVAGAVFLAGTSTITYKYGASDAAFWRLRPNHLLFWHALRTACEDGYRWFDFGRSDLSDRGLRDFKSGWAAEEQPLLYTTLAERAPEDGSGRGLAAARALLRRSPGWACRAAGELFYRYAASS